MTDVNRPELDLEKCLYLFAYPHDYMHSETAGDNAIEQLRAALALLAETRELIAEMNTRRVADDDVYDVLSRIPAGIEEIL